MACPDCGKVLEIQYNTPPPYARTQSFLLFVLCLELLLRLIGVGG